MPELPEVETSRLGIAPYCVNHKITHILVREPRLRWPVELSIGKKMVGQTITQVERRGKYLLLVTGIGQLMIHLGMSGSLRVLSRITEPGKHDHIDITLSSGNVIRFNDPRRFGSVIFNSQGELHPLLSRLGVEPLSDEFTPELLYQICHQRKAAIKSVIMNSRLLVGVGNIYAQEALFRAGIHPARAANKIAMARLARLTEMIKQVLNEAIEAGGSSLNDFTSAEGRPGYFQHTFQVYGRGGKPCKQCQSKLKQMVIAQRTTVYCCRCQR